MTKHDFSTVPLPIPTACTNCGVEERRFLHHVRHRGSFRRLCTTCVLRLHPQSFCPTCFLVYQPTPQPSTSNDVVTCLKCYSLTHTRCVGPNHHNPYICPLCVNPNSPIFVLKKAKDFDFSVDEDSRVVDKKAARMLLAAARIAAVSMNKAAVGAKAEAERRAKEAACTRKRAREALEHVAYLVARDKMMKKKEVLLPIPSNVNREGSNRCLSMVVAAVPLEEENVANGDRLDSSSEVLVALNAVDLRGQNPMHRLPAANNGSSMDVEENGGVMVQNKGVELGKSGNGQREMANNQVQD